MINHILTNKGLNLINVSQLQVAINKTQLLTIVSDALASEDNASLLRAIQPHLGSNFNFPEYPVASFASVHEDGSAVISLKAKPATRQVLAEEQVLEDPTTPEDESEPVAGDE